MPSTYAHYRMGQEVIQRLSEPDKKVIEQYPDLYNIGLHGPDLLFYYKALGRNHVNSMGFGLHKYPGRYFFERAAGILKKKRLEPAHLSYVYGYLCHFALDVTCHGFVNGQIKDTGVGHLALETDLDRRLLLMDGKEPMSTRVTGHLIPSSHSARVIRDFHPGITVEEAYKSIEDMVFYLNALISPGRLKRGLLVGGLKPVGQYDNVGGLLMKPLENPKATKGVDHLLELYRQGRDLAVELIGEYSHYLKGEQELGCLYDCNFESVKAKMPKKRI